MDTTVMRITFDPNGVCNFCRAAETRLSQELYVGDEHAARLQKLLAKIKSEGRNKPYDCIIGVSGGVDSSYTAYLVKRVYGLRPLAVHFDNGWNSELAVHNVENLLKKLDIDLFTHVVDWEEFKDIQIAFLKASVANCEIPTDHAILALLYMMAVKYRVRFIIHGGNLATESIMPAEWMHDAKDLLFLTSIHRRFGSRDLRTMPTMSYMNLAWNILIRRIRYVSFLNYIDYNRRKAIRVLEDELGWRNYTGKHFESTYTRFFQGYFLPEKFHMDKRRPHFSSLIISGQMTREEALEAMELPPYDPVTVREDVKYVCQKFQLSDAEFTQIMNLPVKDSSEYPNSAILLRRITPVVSWIKRVATERRNKCSQY
jgi:N-acetyl sugar amidotransferase